MEATSPERDPPASLQLAVVVGDVISFAPLPAAGSVTLGRGRDCDIRVDGDSVSQRHARLHIGPPLRLEDLGSRNGTFVTDPNTSQPAHTHPLCRLSRQSMDIAVGECFHLGSTTLVVRRAPAPPASALSPNAPEGAILRDPAMLKIYDEATRVAKSGLSVLVLGETGVGKEVLARTIHARSPRAAGPYVEINCGALSPTLLESELFGHEKGSFSGANQTRAGLLESADGGTIFLDEIGDMPLAFQVNLLRVIEQRKVLRVGGRAPRPIDVRFVAATHRDLEKEIARGTFREDLYYRLNGLSLVIPPLRERVTEIAPLAEKFLADACRKAERSIVPTISGKALAALQAYSWPGNVRELVNVMERAGVMYSGEEILLEDLPTAISVPVKPSTLPPDRTGLTEEKAAECARIRAALAQTAGNQTRAAKILGISLRTLVTRLGECGIERPHPPRKQ